MLLWLQNRLAHLLMKKRIQILLPSETSVSCQDCIWLANVCCRRAEKRTGSERRWSSPRWATGSAHPSRNNLEQFVHKEKSTTRALGCFRKCVTYIFLTSYHLRCKAATWSPERVPSPRSPHCRDTCMQQCTQAVRWHRDAVREARTQGRPTETSALHECDLTAGGPRRAGGRAATGWAGAWKEATQ